MYAAFICFIFSTLIFFVFGRKFLQFNEKNKANQYTFFDTYFVGLCLTGTFLNIWSLFLPSNYISFSFLLLTCLILILKEKKSYLNFFYNIAIKLKKEKLLFLVLLLCIVIVLFFSVVTPKLYDSYLYHINAIQWNEKYRAVPGLANLHDRFGFNSSIFVLGASFSFSSIYEQYMFIINSLSYLIFLFWILKLALFFKNVKSIFLLLFVYYFTNQYYLDISSPGSDLLANIFLSYLLINSLLFNDFIFKKRLVVTVISLFCITLKLSTIPILVLGLASTLIKNENLFLSLKRYSILSVLFLLPWVIRNVILSGYVIFPMSSIDLFNFDWKVPVENVKNTQDWVYSWARIPFKDYNEVLKLGFSEWFPIWWNAQISKNQVFFALALLTPFFYLIYILFNHKKDKKLLFIPLSVAYSIFVLWLFTAPDFRFSFSIILILSLFPMLIFDNLKITQTRFLKPFFVIPLFYTIFLIGKCSYNLFSSEYHSIKNISSYIYLPNDIYYLKYDKNIQFTKVKLFSSSSNFIELYEPNPNHSQCFDMFPCSWYIDGNLKLRGGSLQSGFINNVK